MTSRVRIVALTALLAASYLPDRTQADPGPPAPQFTVLFQVLRIFDGKGGSLSAPSNVLVRGNKIDKVSTGPISIDNFPDAITIARGGRTLMPGLIVVHWHAMLVAQIRSRPWPATSLSRSCSGVEATATLRWLTTIRDMGGPVFGLERAIDEGLLAGPASTLPAP